MACELLRELNQDVQGEYVSESLESLLQRNPGFFTPFTVVVATALPEDLLLRLAALLWERQIPLVYARALGMIGYIRIAVGEACVVESHPDDFIHDLRIACPFPELEAMAAAVDFEALSLRQHSHIPWVLILLRALATWK